MDDTIKQLTQRIEALEEHCYEFMTLKEAAVHIRFTESTLRSYVNKKKIPYFKKKGKILFEKKTLTKWMKNEGKPGVDIRYIGDKKVIIDTRH